MSMARKGGEADKGRAPSGFFPRLVREFEDDDEPMVYCGARNGSR